MSYPYPYHLLPFETYQEWFDADWKSLIQCVRGLQNECIYLELTYTPPPISSSTMFWTGYQMTAFGR